MTQGPGADMQEWISQLKAERDNQERQDAPFAAGRAELWSLSQNPVAVALVRDRERGNHKPARKIPITCPGRHNSTHAVVLHVEDEIGEGTPDTPTIFLDVEPGASGSAEAPPKAGGSWTFVCGKCGRRTKCREPKLLKAAIEALLRNGTSYRVNLT